MNHATDSPRRLRPRAGRSAVFLLAVAVVVADQLTKAWVRSALEVGERVEATPWLAIMHVENRGFAFSAFADAGDIVVAISVLVAALLLVVLVRVPLSGSMVVSGLGLLGGGAVGNLVDRVGAGHVTDFVAVGGFPRFNVADAAITVGVLLVVAGQLLAERKAAAAQAAEAPPNDGAAAP